MSSNLAWHIKPKVKELSRELKLAFRDLYGCPIDAMLTDKHTPQLKAMAIVYKQTDKKVIAKELHTLINAIQKYDEVYLKEDFG